MENGKKKNGTTSRVLVLYRNVPFRSDPWANIHNDGTHTLLRLASPWGEKIRCSPYYWSVYYGEPGSPSWPWSPDLGMLSVHISEKKTRLTEFFLFIPACSTLDQRWTAAALLKTGEEWIFGSFGGLDSQSLQILPQGWGRHQVAPPEREGSPLMTHKHQGQCDQELTYMVRGGRRQWSQICRDRER